MLNYASLKETDPKVKALIRAFGVAGAVVISTSADATASKRAGIEYKALHFTYADSQRVSLLVKRTGDVFEVRINDRPVPVRSQDNTKAAAEEIAGKMAAGRARFQKAMTATKAPMPSASIRVSRSTLLTQLTERRDGLKEQVGVARERLASLEGGTA